MPSAPKFEAGQGNPLFEVQFRAVTEALAGNGVLNNGDFQVTDSTNAMDIDIAAGTAYYVATEYSLGAAVTKTLAAADGTYDRWDTVAFDTAANDGTTGPHVDVITGTAEANPTPPDITGDQILLGIVYVPAGATDVGASNILNWRPKFSNESEEVHYNDSTGYWGLTDVESVLDTAPDKFLDAAGDTLSGTLSLPTNPGAFGALIDAVVDGNSAAGTAHRYSLQLDGSKFLEVYAESDGAGGTQNASVRALQPVEVGDDVVTTAGTVIWDSTNGYVPRAQVDDQRLTTSVAANYTTSDEEVVFVDPSGTGGVTITLASADADSGNVIVVQDHSGAADTNPITVDTGSTETIDGQSSVTIDTPYAGATFVSDGSNWTRTGAGDSAQAIEPRMLSIGAGASESIAAGETDTVHVDATDDQAFTVDGALDVDGTLIVEGK